MVAYKHLLISTLFKDYSLLTFSLVKFGYIITVFKILIILAIR